MKFNLLISFVYSSLVNWSFGFLAAQVSEQIIDNEKGAYKCGARPQHDNHYKDENTTYPDDSLYVFVVGLVKHKRQKYAAQEYLAYRVLVFVGI